MIRPWNLWGLSQIEIGDDSTILSGSTISAIPHYREQQFSPIVRIGNRVYIGRQVYITAINEISIGDDCSLSEQVYLTDLSHGFNPEKGPIMKQKLVSKGPVRIGSNCFLGYRVAVMPNVTLGDWCVVGANSVVTRSFPAYSMIAGAPAKLVKIYSHDTGEWVTPPAKTASQDV